MRKDFFARCAHENLFIWVRKASPEGSEKGRRSDAYQRAARYLFSQTSSRERRTGTQSRGAAIEMSNVRG
jgi:hypothetical protein